MHNDLSEIRKRIDEIDEKLIELYRERMALSVEVADFKEKNNLPVFDKKREEEKLLKIKNLSQNEFEEEGLLNLFSILMDDSKKLQNRMLQNKRGEK
ncbi:MAG: chorismate mutase [Lachnospiraceae bacterium]|nr:chorismate mutase [Lachnospiraceae bacterium]